MKTKNRVIVFFLIFILVLNIFSFSSVSASWWDSDWFYYKTCTVANKIDDYQMFLNVSYSSGGDVDCESHCQADFDDLRFVYNNATLLPYWFEKVVSGSYAWVWVNNSGNYSSFDMFYGNAGCGNLSDGATTFDFFDNFSDAGVDWTDRWVSTDHAYYSIVSGNLQCEPPGATAKMINAQPTFNGFKIVCSAKQTHTNGELYLTIDDVVATYNGGEFLNIYWPSQIIRIAQGGAGPYSSGACESLTDYFRGMMCVPSAGNAYYEWKAKNETIMVSHSAAPTDRTCYFGFLAWGGNYAYVDWVVVGKYYTTEPSFSGFGAEVFPPITYDDYNPTSGSTNQNFNPHLNISLLGIINSCNVYAYFTYAYISIGGAAYHDFIEISNSTISSNQVVWFNFTTNALLNLPSMVNETGIKIFWYVNVTDTVTSTSYEFPGSGELITEGNLELGYGESHYCWNFTTIESICDATIDYPINGQTNTSAEWRANSSLIVTVANNTLGWDLCVSGNISVEFITGGAYYTIHSFWVSTDPIVNGSCIFDISEYVPYTDAKYNVSIYVYNYDDYGNLTTPPTGGGLADPVSNLFTIGTLGATDDTRMSIKNCFPPNGEVNALYCVTNGITLELATNNTHTYPNMDIWWFLTNENGVVITYGGRVGTIYFTNYSLGIGFMQSRHHYYLYIGGWVQDHAPADFYPYTPELPAYPLATSLFDNWFDGSANSLGDFTLDYYFWEWRVFPGTGHDVDFYGYCLDFYTYPEGETPAGPETGDVDWSTGSSFAEDLLGDYAWLSPLIGLIMVALFTFIPYILLTKKKKRGNVPLPIILAMGVMGAILAYGLGFFPIWVFILPVLLLIIILIYTIFHKIHGQQLGEVKE